MDYSSMRCSCCYVRNRTAVFTANEAVAPVLLFLFRLPYFPSPYPLRYIANSCEGWSRTTDLQVMSLSSYHLLYLTVQMYDYFPILNAFRITARTP